MHNPLFCHLKFKIDWSLYQLPIHCTKAIKEVPLGHEIVSNSQPFFLPERYRWSGRVVSFPNSTTRTHRLCLRPDRTHGQNPYMSRLFRNVYDQTKSANVSETQADPNGLCRRPGPGLRQSLVGPV